MSETTSGFYWDERAMSPSLSAQEKALRDKFVEEYLWDYDAYQACVRMGFLQAFAAQYSQTLFADSYVQKRIREAQQASDADPKEQLRRDKALALATFRQASRHGPYASRVAAAKSLMETQGLTAPLVTKNEVTHRGGVMMVPATASIDDWEAAATASQSRLVDEARS